MRDQIICWSLQSKVRRPNLSNNGHGSRRDAATPGAGCSITSTATVSTTGAIGCFTFRAAFFTGARLGLALATVRFAAFARADLRALPRLAEFPLGSFPRFCTFARFLRFAMIALLMLRNSTMLYSGKPINASYQQDRSFERAWAGALLFLVALGVGRKPPPVRQALLLPCVHGMAGHRDESQNRRLRTADAFAVCGFERAKWSVGQRSLDDVDLAKAKGLYKRTIYPPPAIQHRTDTCPINAIMIRKSDLASLVVNCGSQQMNDVIFLKDKSVAAQVVGRSNRTSFPIGRPLYVFAVGIAL